MHWWPWKLKCCDLFYPCCLDSHRFTFLIVLNFSADGAPEESTSSCDILWYLVYFHAVARCKTVLHTHRYIGLPDRGLRAFRRPWWVHRPGDCTCWPVNFPTPWAERVKTPDVERPAFKQRTGIASRLCTLQPRVILAPSSGRPSISGKPWQARAIVVPSSAP